VHSSLELLFKKQKGESMTLDKIIIRACCVCKTAILPDGSAVTEREAISQGYVLSHGIHSKDCIKEYIEDAYRGHVYNSLPDYCQKSTVKKEVDVNAESYDKDRIFNNKRC